MEDGHNFLEITNTHTGHKFVHSQSYVYSLVRYVILAIYVANIDFIVFMASLGVK